MTRAQGVERAEMHTDRRSLIALLGGGVAAASISPRAFPSPAIIRGEITPQQFGATGGDASADTSAWNRAILESSRTGRPVLARGTYVLRAPAAAGWNWWRRPTDAVHVAVQLRSGVQILGRDAQILVGSPAASVDRGRRHVLFGTDENLKIGAIRDVVFDGLTFDFREEFGPLHWMTYAIGATGVDGLTRRNLIIKSSGRRAGRGLLSENCRARNDSDIKHINIQQGIYTRYEYGVSMRRISFEGFNEALDFDGPCWDVTLDNLTFKDGFGEAQCIDTGGGARWTISNVTAERTGSILSIYVKGNAWPTYAEWLNSGGAQASNCVPPEKMIARNVRGFGAGRKNGAVEALRIGNPRRRPTNHQEVSPRDITIENWSLQRGAQINVNDCDRLTMRGISLSGTASLDNAERGAALVLREPPLQFGGRITGTVTDVTVTDAAGMAVSVVAGSGLSLDRITVKGYNRDSRPALKGAVRIRPRRGRTDVPRLGALAVDGAASRRAVVDE